MCAKEAVKIKSTIKAKEPEKKVTLPFGKENYSLMLVSVGLLVIGFLLMIGGGSDDPNVFSDKMFDFQRLTLSPIILMAGYILGIFAIIKKPRAEKEAEK